MYGVAVEVPEIESGIKPIIDETLRCSYICRNRDSVQYGHFARDPAKRIEKDRNSTYFDPTRCCIISTLNFSVSKP